MQLAELSSRISLSALVLSLALVGSCGQDQQAEPAGGLLAELGVRFPAASGQLRATGFGEANLIEVTAPERASEALRIGCAGVTDSAAAAVAGQGCTCRAAGGRGRSTGSGTLLALLAGAALRWRRRAPGEARRAAGAKTTRRATGAERRTSRGEPSRMLLAASVAVAALALPGCGPSEELQGVGGGSEGSRPDAARATMAESAEAREMVDELHARFRIEQSPEPSPVGPPAMNLLGRALRATARPVLRASVVDRFEREGGFIRPHLPDSAWRGVIHRARVLLPARANEPFRLRDDDTGMSVRVTLEGAGDIEGEATDGYVAYRGAAPHGGHIVHRVHAEGTEDYITFDQPPAQAEVRYTVALSNEVAGLRLVGNVLEFLDDGGAPRLRMGSPYLVDDEGQRHDATIAVAGCAYDENPRGPWGRAVVPPGAAECRITVTLLCEKCRYPAVLDPLWTTTGSMAYVRAFHTASLLGDGKVLVAGGGGSLPGGGGATEVYDPDKVTWALTGPMNCQHFEHTASVLANGKVLVAGAGATSAELYDPAKGIWVPTADMLPGRSRHTASVLANGKVLVAGGVVLASAALYDPLNGTWKATGSMFQTRYVHAATVLGNAKVLVAGGHNGSHELSGAELYDPDDGTWAPTGSMNVKRYFHTANVLGGGKVLVTGGIGGGKSAELYDPAKGTWTPTENMAKGRYEHTATVLGNGKVLVVGGYGACGECAELFGLIKGGDTCNVDGECDVGWCADKHCCDKPCQELCQACTAAKKGYGKDGVCEPIAIGSDADNECLDEGSPACGLNGLCDGKGACQHYPVPKGCTPEACQGGAECKSGLCADGMCCNSACAGQCQACSAAAKGYGDDGVCELVAAGVEDPNGAPPCEGLKACDGAGQCRKKNGQPCVGAYECVSGDCADKLCCDDACKGPCEACDIVPGTCTAHGFGSDPEGDCGPNERCDGKGACKKKSGQSCVGPGECLSGKCADGFCCDAPCAGPCDVCAALLGAAQDGTCTYLKAGEAGSPSCAPHVCPGGSAACGTSCATSKDCAAVAYCAGGKCAYKKASGALCGLAEECTSDFCVDGVCCQALCNGSCEGCDGLPGICKLHEFGTDPNGECGVGKQCDGSGACKEENGQGCAGGGECLSANCTDGFCCDVPCSGPCDVCAASAGATKDGACTYLKAGAAGSPSCAPHVCPGGSAACGDSCASSQECAPVAYCAAGECAFKKVSGAPCSLAEECTSDFCADGSCCQTACNGTCQGCSIGTGLCTPHKFGTDPDAECGMGGRCDGLGACRKVGGQPCVGGGECLTGNCVDGVCCDTACAGSCDVCAAPLGASQDGTCTQVEAGVAGSPSCAPYVCTGALADCGSSCASGAECAPGAYCSLGACFPKKLKGEPCGSAEECSSGFCVDGYCCNSACPGSCEACDVEGTFGVCANLPANEPPRPGHPSCETSEAQCAGYCSGKSNGCAYPGKEAECGERACTGGREGVAAVHHCDGKGGCGDAELQECLPYACAADGCKASCAADEDCAEKFACESATGKCVPRSKNVCAPDGHTSILADGTTKDCGAYGCIEEDGTCRNSCRNAGDCAPGHRCDSSGRCVPDAAAAVAGQGCTCRAAGAGSGSGLAGLVAVVAAAAWRSRRRALGACRPTYLDGPSLVAAPILDALEPSTGGVYLGLPPAQPPRLGPSAGLARSGR
ncbi:MAG: hypothetical protein HY744_34805 [Deltaproteobacteria bacterium]|nr:hypothetical protein [Deltaproteobacteria bacterium]